jgi:hypothetical protein
MTPKVKLSGLALTKVLFEEMSAEKAAASLGGWRQSKKDNRTVFKFRDGSTLIETKDYVFEG